MERIKLANPGEELTMLVSAVGMEQIENTNYYKLSDDSGREIMIPTSSVDRQLNRLNVTNALGLVGLNVRISRSKELNKYGKSYWNLDPATTATPIAASSVGGSSAARSVVTGHFNPPGVTDADLPESLRDDEPPPSPPDGRPKLTRLYFDATAFVLDHIVPLYVKAGIGCSDTAVAAMTATLYIAASKER